MHFEVTGSPVDIRNIIVYAGVLCLEGVQLTTYIQISLLPTSFLLEGQRARLFFKKPATCFFLHSNHTDQCCISLCVSIQVTKTTTTSRINDVFSCYSLLRDTSGCTSLYTIKDVWANAS